MSKKILLIGEKCLDRHVVGECLRLCPEGPVPVFNPLFTQENDGMAGNLYNNLKSLSNYDIEFIHQESIITKTRFIDNQRWQILLRVDENDKTEEVLDENSFNKILDSRGLFIKDFAVIIISEYGKGYITKQFIHFISSLGNMYGIKTFLDTKHNLGGWSKPVFLVKNNLKEYNQNLKETNFPHELCQNLVVTRGPQPTLLFSNNDKKELNVPYVEKVIEISGAGDSCLAGIVCKYLESNDLEESIIYGNKAASYAVTQKGITTVKKEDIK